jgi:hypothetical protein
MEGGEWEVGSGRVGSGKGGSGEFEGGRGGKVGRFERGKVKGERLMRGQLNVRSCVAETRSNFGSGTFDVPIPIPLSTFHFPTFPHLPPF